MTERVTTAPEALALSKACELEDFVHPQLRPILALLSGRKYPRGPPAYEDGFEERKQWEMAMAIRALDELGALRPDAEILGVGAGAELTNFVLTTRVRRVFATDLYLVPGEWALTANASMLIDPQPSALVDWNPNRLVMQHMSGLNLRYEDYSFDGIYSSSSIEHFGSYDDAARSVEEMHRVLRPGGVLTLATELRLAGPAPGLPGTLLFSPEELVELLGRVTWTSRVDIQLEQSLATRQVVVAFDEAARDVREAKPHWSTYPQLILELGEHRWTSVHVALVKA